MAITIGQIANFTAGFRKTALIPFGLFSPGDNLGFIANIPTSANFAPVNMTGTLDGANAVFTVPGTIAGGAAIYRNGVLQDPLVNYTISGSTVTFNPLYIPQVGDDLQVIFS